MHEMHVTSYRDKIKSGDFFFFNDQILLPVRNGRSSVRVLSTPRARAMVDSFLMLFSRNCAKTTSNVYVSNTLIYRAAGHEQVLIRKHDQNQTKLVNPPTLFVSKRQNCAGHEQNLIDAFYCISFLNNPLNRKKTL